MSPGDPLSASPAPDELPLDYPLPADAYDEMLGSDGRPRPHWASLVRALRGAGRAEMARRGEQARRFIRDNGVTYNVYGDPRGMDRPWQLDAIPLLIPGAEWRALESGLRQRARLLDLILADLYGPQRLLREGWLPPELVFAHPGFLRPCRGATPPANRFLHLHAADLARSPDGRWWVLGDRTQAPSGMGYAVENRLALSRSLPELFRDCRVARLAPFFATLRATLIKLAPRHRDNPRIVLLTPGAHNETYFEHAYLSRYLGFTLVEGGDLTVRDSAVYMKTLEGLQPVDVVVRRLDDGYADPLSLRGDSSLGVPGLVEATRAGTVVVANALGSGLVETAAIMAFLPGLARHLLGEDLELPSVATWWCGDPGALEEVVENLDRLVVKPAFPTTDMDPVFAATLAPEERAELVARMRARPFEFVAQEQVALSTTPIWEDGRFQARHVTLRAYSTATDRDYAVMPGGLTRVASGRDSLVVSMQRGGGSKDTWVLSSGPVGSFTLLPPPDQAVELSRGGNELPSRVADNLFWLGRYIERAEGTVRLLRAVVGRLASESDPSAAGDLPALLDALAVAAGIDAGFSSSGEDGGAAALERELLQVMRAEEPVRALRPTIAAAQRLAAIVRDQISPDTWRVLRRLDDGLNTLGAGHAPLGDVLEAVNRLILAFAAFAGLATENMTRTQGWRFTDMGRRIERVLHTVSLFRSMLLRTRAGEAAVLDAVLEVADSAVTYRRRYLGTVVLQPVLDLLLTDETNPRAIVFQLVVLDGHVRHLPHGASAPFRSPEERLVTGALTRLRLADIEQLCTSDADGERVELTALVDHLGVEMPALSDALTSRYLSHAQTPHRLEEVF